LLQVPASDITVRNLALDHLSGVKSPLPNGTVFKNIHKGGQTFQMFGVEIL
jgi:hypothetical protein